MVIEALKEVDGDRKCFRMVGGVLVERTVKDVLPAMMHNYEQVIILYNCNGEVINNFIIACQLADSTISISISVCPSIEQYCTETVVRIVTLLTM